MGREGRRERRVREMGVGRQGEWVYDYQRPLAETAVLVLVEAVVSVIPEISAVDVFIGNPVEVRVGSYDSTTDCNSSSSVGGGRWALRTLRKPENFIPWFATPPTAICCTHSYLLTEERN